MLWNRTPKICLDVILSFPSALFLKVNINKLEPSKSYSTLVLTNPYPSRKGGKDNLVPDTFIWAGRDLGEMKIGRGNGIRSGGREAVFE